MSISSLADPAIMGRYLSVVKGGAMIGSLPELNEQVQSQAVMIAALQKEVADLRATVARLDPISNKNRPESRMPSFL